MPLAYSYVRFSSKKQELGDSEKRQHELALKWCKDNSYTLDTTFRLNDRGVSAFHGKNVKQGALSRFKEAVETGKVSSDAVLLIENFDRLSREPIDRAFDAFKDLLRLGLTIVTLSDGRKYVKADLSDLTKILVPLVTMQRAHEESSMKSSRLRSVWKSRHTNPKRKYVGGSHPFWLKYNTDKTDFVKIQDKVKMVQKVFSLFLSGKNCSEIAREINVYPIDYQIAVRRLLQNKTVIGVYEPLSQKKTVGIVHNGYFPRIISDADFLKVQHLLQNNKTRRCVKAEYGLNAFTGKMFCAYCGNVMNLAYHKGRSKKGVVYAAYRNFVCKCLPVGWAYEDFLEDFLKCSDEINAALSDSTVLDRMNVLKADVFSKEKLLSRYKEIASGGDIPDGFLSMWKNVETEKNKLEKELAELSLVQSQSTIKINANVDDVSLKNAVADVVDRVDVFFCGSKFNYAKAKASGLRAYALRKKFGIEDKRFFSVHLNYAGVKKRFKYFKSVMPYNEQSYLDMAE